LSNNISAMTDVQNLIKEIEEEMGSETVDVGSETGIERDYYNQGKPNCEVCDD